MMTNYKPKFPFTTDSEKGHRRVSIHDVVKIEVEGPERIKVDCEKPSFFWQASIILTTKHGETFVLSAINLVDLGNHLDTLANKPALKITDTILEREPNWWRKVADGAP